MTTRPVHRGCAQEWGSPPLLVREGGTMPVASELERLLGAPAVLLPVSACLPGQGRLKDDGLGGPRLCCMHSSPSPAVISSLGKLTC